MRKFAIFLLFCLLCVQPSLLDADRRLHSEAWYQKKWCDEHSGQTEVRLSDGTRCDCLTQAHAIEFDFGNKWCEAVGQSLHYSQLTKRKAGIVLILESASDRKYWLRLNETIKHFQLPIRIWILDPGNVP